MFSLAIEGVSSRLMQEATMEEFMNALGPICEGNAYAGGLSQINSQSQARLVEGGLDKFFPKQIDDGTRPRGAYFGIDDLDIGAIVIGARKDAPNGPTTSPSTSRSTSPAGALTGFEDMVSSLNDVLDTASEAVPPSSAAPAASPSPPAGPAAPPASAPPAALLPMAPPSLPPRKAALHVRPDAPCTLAPRPDTPITAAPAVRKTAPVSAPRPSAPSMSAAQRTSRKAPRPRKEGELSSLKFLVTFATVASTFGAGWHLAHTTPIPSFDAPQNVFTRAPEDRCFKAGDRVRIDAPEETIERVLRETCKFGAAAIRKVLLMASHMHILEVQGTTRGLVTIRVPSMGEGQREHDMQLPASFFVLDCDAYGDKPTPTASSALDDLVFDDTPECSYEAFACTSSFIRNVSAHFLQLAFAPAAPTVTGFVYPPAAVGPAWSTGFQYPAAFYAPSTPLSFMEKMNGYKLGDKKRDAPEMEAGEERASKRYMRTASWEPPASSLAGVFSLGSDAPLKGRKGVRR